MSAIISDCGKYRYELRRTVNFDNARKCVFIMLNPSTADAQVDDPTIGRCKGFALRFGCGELVVINLFAFRSPRPRLLYTAPDPVGPDNREHIIRVVKEVPIGPGGHFICAWGTNGKHLNQDNTVLGWLREAGARPQCLHDPEYPVATNKDGTPKHPLYMPGNSELVEYTGRKVAP